MNAPVTTTLAFQNADLLAAIATGEAETAKGLAEAGNVHPNHLNRKIDLLSEEGFVAVPFSGPTHRVQLTEKGHQAVAELRRMTLQDSAATGAETLRHDQIIADPDNPRKLNLSDPADVAQLERLSESIAEKGLLNPIRVTPEPDGRFKLVAGERRWRAIGLLIEAGRLDGAHAIEVKISRDLSPLDRAIIALADNLQRADLHPLDKGHAFKAAMALGADKAAISSAVGVSVKHVEDMVNLVDKLPDDAKRRMRLPKDDPQYLGQKAAIGLIRVAKPKPALDLTPQQELILLEAWDACRGPAKRVHPLPAMATSGFIEIMGDAPTDLDIASSVRQLLEINRVDERHASLRIAPAFAVNPNVGKWLAELNYYTDPAGALAKVRAAVHGDLMVSDIAPGDYMTPWLRAPEPAGAEPTPAAETVSPDEPLSPAMLALAGVKSDKPVAETPREEESVKLTPSQRLALVELSHKLDNCPDLVTHGGEDLAPIGDWFISADAQALQQAYGLVAFMQLSDHGKLARLTWKAGEWFAANGFEPKPFGAGECLIDGDALFAERARANKPLAVSGGLYCTPWLNRAVARAKAPEPAKMPAPAPVPAVETTKPGTPAATPAAAETRPAISDGIEDVASANRLYAAVNQALRDSREEDDHWSTLASEDLAERAHQAVQDGDAMTAIVSLMGLIEREGHDDARNILVGRAEARAEP